jgi:hypothetical protein
MSVVACLMAATKGAASLWMAWQYRFNPITRGPNFKASHQGKRKAACSRKAFDGIVKRRHLGCDVLEVCLHIGSRGTLGQAEGKAGSNESCEDEGLRNDVDHFEIHERSLLREWKSESTWG